MGTLSRRILILALFLVSARQLCNAAGPEVPLMRTVAPQSAKAGDTVLATGEALGENKVWEVFLTDGTNDFKMQILEQTSESIKFKIPPKTPAGRFSLMVLLAREPKFIEQPVYLVVQ